MDLSAFEGSPSGDLVPISGTTAQGAHWLHHAFLPHPLPDAEPPLEPSTHRAVANARAALGALDATAQRLPNPRLFRHSTLRLEAQSTAALEGTYEPLQKVLAADESNPADDSMREVLNYLVVAEHAFSAVESGQRLSAPVLANLQGLLMEGTSGEREYSGEIRPIQVVIGRRDDADPAEHEVTSARFIPPPPGPDLEARVRDLLDWMGEKHGEIDPLVAAAMAHYQFEALHPFHDGNGRLGRLLIVFQLYASGLLTEPSISVSPWFEARRAKYYDALFGVSATGDWSTWVALFAEGIQASADGARMRMLELAQVQQELKDALHVAKVRSPNAPKLIDLAVGQPTFTAADAAQSLGMQQPSAHRLIDNLVSHGLLQQFGTGSYGRRYHAPAVMAALLAHR